jgi:hypothetical protein
LLPKWNDVAQGNADRGIFCLAAGSMARKPGTSFPFKRCLAATGGIGIELPDAPEGRSM